MSRMVAIASGKGGVGKTWLSISLSHALAQLGQRVLLLDADLGLANVDVQLGLGPHRDLGTVLTGRCRLAEAIHRVPSCGFDLLPGRSGSGQLGELDPGLLETLLRELQTLAGGYDLTVLDLPAGIDRIVRRLLAVAATRLVVVTEEPTALTDAYALIKTARRELAGTGLQLVINLAASRQAGQQTYRGLLRVCERFLDLQPPLAGIVRRDLRVAEAIRHQVPFLFRHPLSPAARDVEALAHDLVART